MPKTIRITVKLFAAYQEVVGLPELTIDLPAGSRVASVGDYLRSHYPALTPLQSVTQFGVNLEFVSPDRVLQAGDEVVLIPPVSGG
ncbi:MAG: MoaD/ThiS family protein [Acaryochloridaceae cyanobacterium SU_2_1]|nr:MoaD/ThiS family protein [Acaryochloridaceae cyanobacterium SU_2_1]NJM95547.1 MoaD/ThiS family protein [Acaryochloridaceae cyanobacterium CSU_5_19]